MKKPRGLLLSWLVSYLLILVLPVVAYVMTWMVTGSVVEDEVRENNLMMVRQMRRLLDERLEDALCVRDYLRSDMKISALFPLHLPLDAQDHYDLWRASDSMNTQILQNQFIDSGYIYIHETGQSMCNGSLYDYDLLMNVVHSGDQMDREAWRECLEGYHYSDFVTLPCSSGGRRIALLSSIPASTLSRPSATLVLLLDTDNYLRNVTDARLGDDSAFFLVDGEGSIVAKSQGGDEALLSREGSMEAESGFFSSRVQGKNLVCTYATLEITGWKYVLVAALTLSQRLTSLKMLMMISVIVSALGGLLLAYWLAKRKFADIHALIERLASKSVRPQTVSGNEYQQIEQILDDSLRNTDRLDRIIQAQTQQLRRHALERLLLEPQDSEDVLASAGMTFRFEYFQVVLVFLNETTESTIEAAERDRLLQGAVDVLIRQCEPYADVQALLFREMGVVLLNTEQQGMTPDQEEAMELAVGEEQQRLRRQFRYLGVSISASRAGSGQVSAAYQEALSWARYALMLPPGNNAIYHAEKGGLNAQSFVVTAVQESLLADTIASGNEAAARSLTEKLCEPLYGEPVDRPILRCFFFDLLAGLLRAQDGEETRQLVNAAVREVENAQDVQQMQVSFERVVMQLVKRQAPANQPGETTLQEEILRLIEENYADANFNITRLAEMMGRNLSYLSKYFKDRTGVGLYDYLNRIRIAHAKKLIDQSDAPISSLIGQAGFENLGSFIRVFKKYEGITPGAYQKSERKA